MEEVGRYRAVSAVRAISLPGLECGLDPMQLGKNFRDGRRLRRSAQTDSDIRKV